MSIALSTAKSALGSGLLAEIVLSNQYIASGEHRHQPLDSDLSEPAMANDHAKIHRRRNPRAIRRRNEPVHESRNGTTVGRRFGPGDATGRRSGGRRNSAGAGPAGN